MQCLAQSCIWQITTKPLQPSSTRYESYSKTCIRPVGKCELLCWARGKGIKYYLFSSGWWKLHALTMQILLWECGSNPGYKGCWKWQHSRWGRNAVEHNTRLGAVLQLSKDYNLRLKRSRKKWSSIISHVFSHDGLKTNPEKVREIVCFTPFPFFLYSVKVTCTPAVFVGIKGVLVQAY